MSERAVDLKYEIDCAMLEHMGQIDAGLSDTIARRLGDVLRANTACDRGCDNPMLPSGAHLEGCAALQLCGCEIYEHCAMCDPARRRA